MALRVTSAYRTVSSAAILVVAGVTPIHLMATQRTRAAELETEGLTRKEAKARADTEIMLQWQAEWLQETKGAWTRRLLIDVSNWARRKHGAVNFHLTQFLTGNGCFGA